MVQFLDIASKCNKVRFHFRLMNRQVPHVEIFALDKS